MYVCDIILIFFFFNDTATTEIYTLSLHDALPISAGSVARAARGRRPDAQGPARPRGAAHRAAPHVRALRGGPLRVPRAPPPALGAGQRPARQLADERLGPRGAAAVPHARPGRRALRRLTYGGVLPRRTPTSSR